MREELQIGSCDTCLCHAVDDTPFEIWRGCVYLSDFYDPARPSDRIKRIEHQIGKGPTDVAGSTHSNLLLGGTFLAAFKPAAFEHARLTAQLNESITPKV